MSVDANTRLNLACEYINVENALCTLVDVKGQEPAYDENCNCSECRIDLLELRYSQNYRITEEGIKNLREKKLSLKSKVPETRTDLTLGALETADAFLQSVIDGVAEPVMIHDLDYRVKVMNKAAREFALGQSEVPEPLYCYQISHDSDTPCEGSEHPCPLQMVKESGESVKVVHRHSRADGTSCLVEVTASPLRGVDGTLQGIIESSRDLTVFNEMGDALKKSEENYRSIVEGASDAIITADVAGNILSWNRRAEKILGYKADEIIGHPISTLIPDEEKEGSIKLLMKAQSMGHVDSVETVRLAKDGSLVPVELTLSSIKNDLNEVIGISGIVRDITRRKKVEEEVKRAALEWSSSMDASDDVIYLLDLDRRILRANKVFYQMTGLTPETALGRHIVEVIHPEGEIEPCPVCRAQEDKQDLVTVLEADHPDNPAGRPIEITIKMVRDEDGQPMSIYMNLHDLTQSRKAEETLRKSEVSLKKAEHLGQMGYWEWDITTNELAWSDQTYRLYGLDPEKDEPKYEVVVDTLCPECKDEFIKAVEDALGGKPFDGEYCLILPDGTRRYTHTIGEVTFDNDGKPLRMFGMVQDITERKKLEEENLRVKDEKIKAMEEHRAYTFEVADRLRNPLQIFKSSLEMLEDESLTCNQKEELLGSIQQSSKDLEEGIKKLT